MAPQPPTSLRETPPETHTVTDYDLSHSTTYIRLLDADSAGADWREVAEVVLGLDVDSDPECARRTYRSHLARAQWMTQVGYRHLLQRTDAAHE